MKLNIIILTVACLSCLVPSAYGHLLLAKSIAAAGAAKGAALLGAGALAAKGAAVAVAKGAVAALAAKGAAVVAAKHAALKSAGAAVLGAKALAIKTAAAKGAALLAAKGAALSTGVEVVEELPEPAVVQYVPHEPAHVDVVHHVPHYEFRQPSKVAALLAAKGAALSTGVEVVEELPEPAVVQYAPYEPAHVDVVHHVPHYEFRQPSKVAALLAAKGAALSTGVEVVEELPEPAVLQYAPYEPAHIDVRRVPYYEFRQPLVAEVHPAYPTLLADRVSALVGTASASLAHKASAAGTLLAALDADSVYRPPVVLEQFDVVEEPGFFSVPVVKKDC